MENETPLTQNGLKKNKQMIMIAGAGQAGYQLTRILLKKSIETVLIEKDQNRYKALIHSLGASSVRRGDACDADFLRNNGIARATMVFGLTGDDEDNFMFCKLAQMLGNNPTTVSRLNNLDNSDFFHRYIDRVVSLTRDVKDILGFESCFQEIQQLESPNKKARYQPFFLNVTKEVVGQDVRQMETRHQARAILLYRANDNFFPNGDEILQENDHLLVVKDSAENAATLKHDEAGDAAHTITEPIAQ